MDQVIIRNRMDQVIIRNRWRYGVREVLHRIILRWYWLATVVGREYHVLGARDENDNPVGFEFGAPMF